jgi:hypothetical protein
MGSHFLHTVGAATCVAATAIGVAMGCGSNSGSLNVPSNPPKDAATDSRDAAVTSMQTGDSGPPTLGEGGASADGAADGGLYARLGGHTGIRAAVNAVVMAEAMDPDIGTYFAYQAGAPANGHPTTDQIEECFTDYIGALTVVGGTETYPTTVTDDAGMWTCRSMTAAHMDLGISGGTFDHFIAVAGSTLLSLGVSTNDLSTLAAALETSKPQVVGAGLYDAALAPYGSDE